MLRRSTIQLLRFPFSLFLMPVYWFALSQVVEINPIKAVLIFFILHFLLYPASNGYNCYMDRDEGSIGALKTPLQPTRQLFYATIFMDAIAVALGAFISVSFIAGTLLYIAASRAYSYRGIRLKKYPVIGYLTVILFQGALIYFMVFGGSRIRPLTYIPWIPMIAASLLVGGAYPLTQVYQHEADKKDGVRTISAMLGYKGTFIFSALIYLVAFFLLAYYFFSSFEIKEFLGLTTCLLPVFVYFNIWAVKVWRNSNAADFGNAMRMNILASLCTNLGFIVVILLHQP